MRGLRFGISPLAGGLMLFAYALYRKDPVFVLGQGLGVFIYIRNPLADPCQPPPGLRRAAGCAPPPCWSRRSARCGWQRWRSTATDVFVDEAQYWLWGQRLDLGYYSKPPLIGWLLRAVSEIRGRCAVLGCARRGSCCMGRRRWCWARWPRDWPGGRPALWAAGLYLSLPPFVTMGGLFISTDTVMAPFYAGRDPDVLGAPPRAAARVRRWRPGRSPGWPFWLNMPRSI